MLQPSSPWSIHKHIWDIAYWDIWRWAYLSEQWRWDIEGKDRDRRCTQSCDPCSPSGSESSEVLGCNTHWVDQRDRDQKLNLVSGTHWGWAQGQGQRKLQRSQSATKLTRTQQWIPQTGNPPTSSHCVPVSSKILAQQIAKWLGGKKKFQLK